MIILMLAALTGSVATVSLLPGLGLFAILALAPIGGSAAALVAAVALALSRRDDLCDEGMHVGVDEQVAALRQVLQIARSMPTERAARRHAA